MPDFVVHSIPGSPFGRAVLATLEEKGESWTLQPVRPGSSRQPAHLQRHPFGRVPVLEHGDFRLYETQAILRYLDRVLPQPPLTPADPRQAARMDQVMGVNDWYLFSDVARPIVFHRVVAPRLLGATPDEAAIAAALPQAAPVIAELSRLLADQPFMAGDALSLADLHVGPHLAMLAETPEWAGLTEPHPNLAPWLRRLQARRSFAQTTWECLIERAEAA